MEKLNELILLAEEARDFGASMDMVDPEAIIAIAGAFRALEQRAEAAEALAGTWKGEAIKAHGALALAGAKLEELAKRQCGRCGDRLPVSACPCQGESACWLTNAWHETKLVI